jgi:hypothetical protein
MPETPKLDPVAFNCVRDYNRTFDKSADIGSYFEYAERLPEIRAIPRSYREAVLRIALAPKGYL